MTSRNGKQLQSFKGVTKILNFELRKILISINVPSKIKAHWLEKMSEINKCTGTFILYLGITSVKLKNSYYFKYRLI